MSDKNRYLIQVVGPFLQGSSIFNDLPWKIDNEEQKIEKIAIQIAPNDLPIVDRNSPTCPANFLSETIERKIKLGSYGDFNIGFTGVFELDEIEILQEDEVYFYQNEPETTIIDIVLTKAKVIS